MKTRRWAYSEYRIYIILCFITVDEAESDPNCGIVEKSTNPAQLMAVGFEHEEGASNQIAHKRCVVFLG